MNRRAAITIALAMAAPAAAMSPEELRPVDQAVGDIDPLAVSLRRTSPRP
jgi:hypothetical protein